MLNNKTILITGGTGSFGNAFTRYVLENYDPKKVIIYSRDEYKQFVMRNKFIALGKEAGVDYDSKLRFFIGDVRDEARLRRAFKDVDYVVHAAALKQVPACAGSRGSVIPFFDNLAKSGATELPITDMRMTRFWISLDEGIRLVVKALEESEGGETYISKIPSFRVTDLATAMAPDLGQVEVGIREGEKLHECMVPEADSLTTYEYERHFVIYPHMEWCDLSITDLKGGKKVEPGFVYDSGTNTEWLTVEQLRELLSNMEIKY